MAVRMGLGRELGERLLWSGIRNGFGERFQKGPKTRRAFEGGAYEPTGSRSAAASRSRF